MYKNPNSQKNKCPFSAFIALFAVHWCRHSKRAFNGFLLILYFGVWHKQITFDFTAIPTPNCHHCVGVDHESPSRPILWHISLEPIFTTLRNCRNISYIVQIKELVELAEPESGWMLDCCLYRRSFFVLDKHIIIIFRPKLTMGSPPWMLKCCSISFWPWN